jgi:hypothetical protein
MANCRLQVNGILAVTVATSNEVEAVAVVLLVCVIVAVAGRDVTSVSVVIDVATTVCSDVTVVVGALINVVKVVWNFVFVDRLVRMLGVRTIQEHARLRYDGAYVASKEGIGLAFNWRFCTIVRVVLSTTVVIVVRSNVSVGAGEKSDCTVVSVKRRVVTVVLVVRTSGK